MAISLDSASGNSATRARASASLRLTREKANSLINLSRSRGSTARASCRVRSVSEEDLPSALGPVGREELVGLRVVRPISVSVRTANSELSARVDVAAVFPPSPWLGSGSIVVKPKTSKTPARASRAAIAILTFIVVGLQIAPENHRIKALIKGQTRQRLSPWLGSSPSPSCCQGKPLCLFPLENDKKVSRPLLAHASTSSRIPHGIAFPDSPNWRSSALLWMPPPQQNS